ncbi:MAG: 5-(carboxyamino)imidazole ribonucleotide synthase [Flavobacteriales bacterium]|nr:5-(carboxyamino)imidazole ribonucleotide synthase [Flavobacteriales bacterium]
MYSRPFDLRIGIVGGGQLGKMLIESALPWNVRFNVLDPDPGAPCARYADIFISGSLTDREKILELAAVSDILTFEIEHIDVETLIEIQRAGKRVVPDPEILKVIQDKSAQKQFFKGHDLDSSDFEVIETEQQLKNFLEHYTGAKLVVKSSRGGYDGKGVWICNTSDLRSNIIPFPFNGGSYVLEEFIPDVREISVIVARNKDGGVAVFPTCEMVFDPELNLVDHLYSPSNLTKEDELGAETLALNAIQAMNGVGLFAVELFRTSDGQFLINEIAPRPHNSGHHTIEANTTSQYEQLMRVLLDLPLGSTRSNRASVMMNLIGPANVNGAYRMEGLKELFAIPGLSLHWYNKQKSRPGRKMGHLTICADTVEEALDLARTASTLLRLEPL